MNESYLSTVLKVRLLVDFLGEKAHCAWWPTAFYDPSRRLFLEPVFSKTAGLAQYHGVLQAARAIDLWEQHFGIGRPVSSPGAEVHR